MFIDSAPESREVFFRSWHKYQHNEMLEPLEKQLVNLILEHPEYHAIFSNPEKYREYIFDENNEINPFLHLGLHLSIHEQAATNRPKGITAVCRDLVIEFGDAHHAEHHIMDILQDHIQQMLHKKNPDDKAYIKQLKKLLKKGCQHSH